MIEMGVSVVSHSPKAAPLGQREIVSGLSAGQAADFIGTDASKFNLEANDNA
jgi:hypothetical protein